MIHIWCLWTMEQRSATSGGQKCHGPERRWDHLSGSFFVIQVRIRGNCLGLVPDFLIFWWWWFLWLHLGCIYMPFAVDCHPPSVKLAPFASAFWWWTNSAKLPQWIQTLPEYSTPWNTPQILPEVLGSSSNRVLRSHPSWLGNHVNSSD